MTAVARAQTVVPPRAATQTAGPPPLRFEGAKAPGTKVTVAAVGDILLHGPLQRQGINGSFSSLYKDVIPLLSQADVAYGNLEGPAAAGVNRSGRAVRDPGRYDGNVYSSYPQFNYHPRLVQALKNTGFDVVSTANNHSLDRRALGVDRTLDALDRVGLKHTGTRRVSEPNAPMFTITQAKNVRIAWVAATFSTNGIPDSKKQVLDLNRDRAKLLQLVKNLKNRNDVDAVIVTPHWGEEYKRSANFNQRQLARQLLNAGASAIIGAHPHVTQPWEKVKTADGREGFIIYSLGNFISGQNGLDRRSAIVLHLGFTKTPQGKTVINGVKYVPLHMRTDGGRYRVVPTDKSSVSRESERRTVSMFGTGNKAKSTDKIDTANV